MKQSAIIFEALGEESFARDLGASHFKSLEDYGLSFTLPFKVKVKVINIENTDRYNLIINNKTYTNLHKVILKPLIIQHLKNTLK